MSVVFQAENWRLGNVVALKILAPDLANDDIFPHPFPAGIAESPPDSTTRMSFPLSIPARIDGLLSSRCAMSRAPTCGR